jgi:hypothetical protein
MAAPYKVTVVTVDTRGRRNRGVLAINDALLAVLRFARKNPHASCTIELREALGKSDPPGAATEREPSGDTILRAFDSAAATVRVMPRQRS